MVLTGRFVLGPPVDRGERMSDEISEILVLLSLAALTVARCLAAIAKRAEGRADGRNRRRMVPVRLGSPLVAIGPLSPDAGS